MATKDATIADVIHDAALRLEAGGIDDARLEAEVLLAHALSLVWPQRIDRSHLLARMPESLATDAANAFERLLVRRLRHEPLAYITGRREFYGIEIICGPGALIPRPESELLVDIALREAAERGGPLRIADAGAGTAAIAIAIARHAPEARVTAIERSTTALAAARKNIDAHGLRERVQLVEGDLLEGTGVFDVIVANVPYVPRAVWETLAPEVRDYEPREALVGGERGTEITERLLAQASGHLATAGVLAVEMDPAEADALRAAARKAFPGAQIDVVQDLAGRARVLVVRAS